MYEVENLSFMRWLFTFSFHMLTFDRQLILVFWLAGARRFPFEDQLSILRMRRLRKNSSAAKTNEVVSRLWSFHDFFALD